MTPEWREYTGSDKQIDEMEESLGGYVLLLEAASGTHQTKLLYRDDWTQFDSERIIKYLICEPHPYADMICQQARTGQPVWVKTFVDCSYAGLPIKDTSITVTNTPDWNIPGAEYSFTQFED